MRALRSAFKRVAGSLTPLKAVAGERARLDVATHRFETTLNRLNQDAPGRLSYRCNGCGGCCKSLMNDLQRELPSCPTCGSTMRWRGVIHALSMELFERSLALPDFPIRKDISGIGMSDWDGYALRLVEKFSYVNTFYHQEPRLDITSINSGYRDQFDFVISSDVFEHVAPPVSRSFLNTRRLLRTGGILVFTVPYTRTGSTVEHFPQLQKYAIVERRDGPLLRNIREDGIEEVFEDLVFHGGTGATLEMRVFSEPPLMEELARAGFGRIRIHRAPDFIHGIFWSDDLSLPISARAG